jgi:hypothetical protein
MKTIRLIPILGLFALACAYTILLPATPAPIASPTYTVFNTSTLTPTITPTQPTPTFTSTPTYIYLGPTEGPTETPQPTVSAAPLLTVQATSTGISQFQLASQSPVFDAISISGTRIVWGASCTATSVTVSTHIAGDYKVTSVLLFTRLTDQTGATTTDWNNGAIMDNAGQGTFTYNLTANVIKHYKDFTTAWVQFQLVATNANGRVLGRTQIFSNNISIAQCP